MWAPGKSFPGCAFTRSIGDSVAESIGVTAEPELLRKELTDEDQFVVLVTKLAHLQALTSLHARALTLPGVRKDFAALATCTCHMHVHQHMSRENLARRLRTAFGSS